MPASSTATPSRDDEITRVDPPKPTSTAAYLEHISTAIIEALTSCDDAVILNHLSPDFEMITACEELPVSCPTKSAASLEQHLQNMAWFRKQFPKWTLEVSNARCNMTKGSSTAEVWLSCQGLRTPESQMFNRETVHVVYWRRSKTQGNWVCYRHQALGGGGNFF
ncbi:uncharacterized protein RCC_00218 [Ramularia collo-cygni]|uniref:SnoaL-like domain-containing protein n=1 Tax=Ramularia collo-cygni TaxID=112498 RepID=A0A2D3V1Y8_9PEZI|nr:uncharacterized protein RCC_00218 [Ramularia collo-cygni]CZT14243.1 uncharacterized protein RCC_00218 [Ramularia collo-cygni]